VTVEQVKRSAAAAQAVSEIQTLVRNGELLPGGRLPPERELARELGVSRSTLREAIRALVAMNILVSRHGDGTYVSSLEPEMLSQPFAFVLATRPALISHLFEARRLLESACARLAAERITDEELAELERLTETVDAGPDELIDRDVALHTALVRATGNPILAGLAGSIGALGLESRRDSVRVPGQAQRTRAQHKRIVAALRRRAPDEAAAAMDAHLRSVERALARWRRSA
jgi:GntR family transcriptional regulator, transcriptional repressor for pyruvate dehydrogenase complex